MTQRAKACHLGRLDNLQIVASRCRGRSFVTRRASPVSLEDYRVWTFEPGVPGTQDDAASPVSLGDYRVWRHFGPRDSGTGSYK